MTKLELFKKVISKARAGGYMGDDYKSQLGVIIDGTNIYSLIFREDFAKAIWGDDTGHFIGDDSILPKWKTETRNLASSEDKWKYLEDNLSFND